MEDLVDFVSKKTKLPMAEAQDATSATLEYLAPRFSPLLKHTVEVLLCHPHLTEAEKDLLIASRVLFPGESCREGNPLPPDN